MRVLVAGLAGIRAAVTAPGWIEDDRLGTLTTASHATPAATGTAGGESTRPARRTAWLTLRLLARLQPRRWRTTCLYRSVAECLALRALGVPCHVELSAGRHPSTGKIEAHAILRADGTADVDEEFRTPLRPVGVSARGTG